MKGCLRWSDLERCYVLACWDDLCHGGSTTICGLEDGFDFNTAEDGFDYDDGWDDE